MKTPLQKEALEAAFLSEFYPAVTGEGHCLSMFHLCCRCTTPLLPCGHWKAADVLPLLVSHPCCCWYSPPLTWDMGALAVNAFPAEEVRAALGNRIGLSEQQVQVELLLQPRCCDHQLFSCSLSLQGSFRL